MSSQIKTKNVTAYVRMSSVSEENYESIVSEQERECVIFAEKLFPNCNLHVYVDEGVPAKDLLKKSGGLVDMLYDIEEEKTDVVIVYKADRLGRNIKDLEQIYNIADEYDVPIYEAESGALLNLKNNFEKQVAHVIAKYEINHTTKRLQNLFNYRIQKAHTIEMKEYLKEMKEDFLLELE